MKLVYKDGSVYYEDNLREPLSASGSAPEHWEEEDSDEEEFLEKLVFHMIGFGILYVRIWSLVSRFVGLLFVGVVVSAIPFLCVLALGCPLGLLIEATLVFLICSSLIATAFSCLNSKGEVTLDTAIMATYICEGLSISSETQGLDGVTDEVYGATVEEEMLKNFVKINNMYVNDELYFEKEHHEDILVACLQRINKRLFEGDEEDELQEDENISQDS